MSRKGRKQSKFRAASGLRLIDHLLSEGNYNEQHTRLDFLNNRLRARIRGFRKKAS